MTNYFTSETLTVSGESVFLGNTVLGAYALIGGDNILMNDEFNTVSLVQDVSINSLNVNNDASFNGDVKITQKLGVTGDTTMTGLLNSNGGISNDGTLITKASPTTSNASASQIACFESNPSSTKQTIKTRTPTELRGDMGLNNIALTLTGTTISASNTNSTATGVSLPIAAQDVSGIVSTGTQTFSGDKTFKDKLYGSVIFNKSYSGYNITNSVDGNNNNDADPNYYFFEIPGSSIYATFFNTGGGGNIRRGLHILSRNGDTIYSGLVLQTTYSGNIENICLGIGTVPDGYRLKVSGSVYLSTGYTSSDDRLKKNEKYITNAIDTIMKLRPQTYDKYENLDCSGNYIFESGLIAQEVYYDCIELRHLINMPDDADISDNINTSNDPTIDPDYSCWGSTPTAINYNGLIAYCIQAIKEQQEIINEEKEKTKLLENEIINIKNYLNINN